MTLAKGNSFVKIPGLMRLRFGFPLAALMLFSPLNPTAEGPTAYAESREPQSTSQVKKSADVEVREFDQQPIYALTRPDNEVSELSRGARQPDWVIAQPTPETQVKKSVSERGVNPCMAPDPGFREFTAWDRSPSIGQMILPKNLKLGQRGQFDVFIHFHGHEPARKSWVQAMESAVLVGIDLGIGSGAYMNKFSVPGEFDTLLASVEAGVRERLGVERANVRHLGLSAWSAGYGAVGEILKNKSLREQVDTVVLLDGLHTGYDRGNLDGTKLKPFTEFAELAVRGKKLMFVSHSSIVPPDYASTTETASYLIWRTGGKPHAARTRSGDPMGLDLVRRYTRGNFHVRGFAGNDALDHCAHLGLFKDVLRTHVVPRWKR